MRAADRPGASPLLASPVPEGKVSVVRVDRRTGKLVRTVTDRGASPAQPAATSSASASSNPVPAKIPAKIPGKINDLVEKSAQANGVDPLLVHSVIQVESGYNRYAMSPKGAEGLMQLMPSTARMLGVGNSFDEAQNIEAGVKYLKYLQGLYKDDRLALAAYNAGPASVDRFKQIPPYPETQAYVERVAERYRAAHQAEQVNSAAKKAATPRVEADAAAEPPPVEKHPKLEQFFDDNGRLSLRTKNE